MAHVLLAVLLVFAAGGCSLKRSADNMERDTEELKHNSRGLKNDSEKLGKRTLDLEKELTFKESADMMIVNLRRLFGEDELPVTAEALPSREPDLPFYAGVVVKSMWFQFWKGDYGEDIGALDERFEIAAEILLVRAIAYTQHDPKVDVLVPDRPWKALGALGAHLHLMRPEYERSARALNVTDMSMYDVIVRALKVRHELEPAVQFPRATAKVNQYAQAAAHMLQLRQNYLPTMVLCMMTDLKDLGVMGRAWMKFVTGRKVRLSDYTPAQLREWTSWLRMAVQTRADLKAMGIEPEYNRTLIEVAQAVDFGQKELLSARQSSGDGLARLQYEFAQAYVAAVGMAR